MKIQKAIFAVDDSYFLEFWPLQAKICKELLRIDPVLFYICEEDSEFYNDGHGLVKKIKKVEGVNTGLLACISRMYGTKFFQDEVCITCDLDMLMINKSYFIDQVEVFDENSLVIYSSDAYDLNRPEAQELFKNEPFPFTQEMYNYPYNAAKGKIFNRILDTDCSFEDFVLRHASYKPGYKFMWMIDEFYFSDCVNHKDHGVTVHKLKRGYTSPWIADNRIERHNFPVELEWESERNAQVIHGFYDEEKLKQGYYFDINCCRPYSRYKEAIDNVINVVLGHKNKRIAEDATVKTKKVALISTFCDTEEKVKVFSDTVDKIKELGIDVIALGPNFINIPNELISKCDYFFFTKDNPLLGFPERRYTHWYEMPISEDRITTIQRGLYDYGWAALYQTKKLSQIALSFDYDVFYHLIYDLEIDETVKNELLGSEVNLVHPRRDPHHPDTLWETTLHFMVFDRNMMQLIEKEITLDNYQMTNGVAEGEVLKWRNKYGLKTSDHPVKDLIFYWEGKDFFDYEVHDDFKTFLSKNVDHEIWLGSNPIYEVILPSTFRIVFHSLKNDKLKENGICVIINGVPYLRQPKEWVIEEFPISSQDIKELQFVYDGNVIDFTKQYQDIMFNQIYYNHR